LVIEAKTKVTRNYQITIPSTVREILGVKIGSYVKFVADPTTGRVYLEKTRAERKRIKIGRKLSPAEIDEIIERGLAECMRLREQ
jgi:AbrB family looped-hinge helix DNA binding protein